MMLLMICGPWLALPATGAGTPEFKLVYPPSRRISCQLICSDSLADFKLREWVFYQLQPPASPRQDVTLSATRGKPGHEEGPRHRPLVYIDEILPSDTANPAIDYTLTFEGCVRRVDLVPLNPGDPPPHAEPLTERELALYLPASKMIDYHSAGFREWLDAAQLHRRAGENDLDLARRIYLAMRSTFKYGAMKNDNKASDTVRDRLGVCVNLSRVYAGALRANRIPARVLCLNLCGADRAASDTGTYGHANNEFYLTGVGWVPCDLTLCVRCKTDEAALKYFGHDRGDTLILFDEDEDIIVDTATFGAKKQTVSHDFRKSYPVRVRDRYEHAFWGINFTGKGSPKVHFHEEWHVQQSIDPSAYRGLQVLGMPQVAASPALAIWRDPDGWHIRSHSDDDQPHQWYIRVVPEGGSIAAWNHPGGKPGAPKQELDEDRHTNKEFGFDFTPTPETKCLKIFLKIDKSDDILNQIFISQSAWHPSSSPIYLPTQ